MSHLDLSKPNVDVVSVSKQRLNGMQLLCLSVSEPSWPAPCSFPHFVCLSPTHSPAVFMPVESMGKSTRLVEKQGSKNSLMGPVLFPVYRMYCKLLLTSLSFREWYKMWIWLFGPQRLPWSVTVTLIHQPCMLTLPTFHWWSDSTKPLFIQAVLTVKGQHLHLLSHRCDLLSLQCWSLPSHQAGRMIIIVFDWSLDWNYVRYLGRSTTA